MATRLRSMEPSPYLVLINIALSQTTGKIPISLSFSQFLTTMKKKMSAFIFLSTINVSLKNKHVSLVSNYILFNCDDWSIAKFPKTIVHISSADEVQEHGAGTVSIIDSFLSRKVVSLLFRSRRFCFMGRERQHKIWRSWFESFGE